MAISKKIDRDIYHEDHEATYCPEDNKLRLYVGRVPRDEYEALRAEGWKSSPKQDCDFVATWTPGREDTAMEYAGYIGDEDQSPEDRAADRAERFGEYRDKRRAEASGHADTFDAGPSVHGYQNQDRAERSARRHDRHRRHAVNQWSKAEYWQHRTEGVISNALYKSSAHVRRGRILKLEAEQRKNQASIDDARARYEAWKKIAATESVEDATKMAKYMVNCSYGLHDFEHPRTKEVKSLYWLLENPDDPINGHEAATLYLERFSEPCVPGSRWADHYQNRLDYERAMLEADGGTATEIEMVAGGWIGETQICKVNKSPATGAVVSIGVWGKHPWRTNPDGTPEMGIQTVNIQRIGRECGYRAPTAEELAEFQEIMKERRGKANAKKPKAPPMINPTPEAAKTMQDAINKNRRKEDGAEPMEMTQKEYSARSKSSFRSCETFYIRIDEAGRPVLDAANRDMYCQRRDKMPILCRVRAGYISGDGGGYRVIVLTDKPQKAFPAMPKPAKEMAIA